MPSLFDEYRTLLELLDAVIQDRIDSFSHDPRGYVTRGELQVIVRTAIAQVNAAEAKAS